jgi:Ser/Thr protein kinase RdoA (MazF antagonist)
MPRWIGDAVSSTFDLRMREVVAPLIGEESVGWRVESDQGPLAIQLAPSWRTEDEVEWVHQRMRAFRRHVPEVVTPLLSGAGASAVPTRDRLITVFPFVDGRPLDDADEGLRLEAARVLARIHTVGLTISAPPRPPVGALAPSRRELPPDPPEMRDPDLDRWEQRLDDEPVLRGLIHGDFYGRNLICDHEGIAGVIDWMEMERAPLVTELGWVIWEFSQVDDGDDLDLERAQAFLDAYRVAGGTVPTTEEEHLVPAIRKRLRAEVRASFAEAAAHGRDPGPDPYRESEMRAFSRLRDVRFP